MWTETKVRLDKRKYKNIKSIKRFKKGIKQKWLAEQLGKSYNRVNSYAKNRRQPSLETLFEIAKILNVEVKSLIKED